MEIKRTQKNCNVGGGRKGCIVKANGEANDFTNDVDPFN